jgi:hypothetical protein
MKWIEMNQNQFYSLGVMLNIILLHHKFIYICLNTFVIITCPHIS